MRIEIHAPESIQRSDECRLRAVLLNDSYEPVSVSRNAFVGPNLRLDGREPSPASVEPTFGQPDEPLTLHPFSFYGRERSWTALTPGEAEITASYRSPDGQVDITATARLRVN